MPSQGSPESYTYENPFRQDNVNGLEFLFALGFFVDVTGLLQDEPMPCPSSPMELKMISHFSNAHGISGIVLPVMLLARASLACCKEACQ